MTILEAFSYSSVIATDVGGCSDIILDGYNGFIVPPLDVNSLANALSQFAYSSKSFSQLSRAALLTYERLFSFSTWQSKVLKLLN